MRGKASLCPADGQIVDQIVPGALSKLPTPEPGRRAAEDFVATYLRGLFLEETVVSSPVFRGGQSAATNALSSFDVAGYAAKRNEVYPARERGASKLSPYIRYGLLSLSHVWTAVERAAQSHHKDVRKFRDELLWQEYARHWYARLGSRTATATRNQYGPKTKSGLPWDDAMGCAETMTEELEEEGWLVNQTRMWFASHWVVRSGLDWRDGENYFFTHLLDGSRAANRLGWQWTTGLGSTRAYGFSRWQVERRAPGLCSSCDYVADCPIDTWPADPDLERIETEPLLISDPNLVRTRGPRAVEIFSTPEAVWITAESLGHYDPALAANPNLPAVFVFDEPLLKQLQLSSKRLVFLVETLAELGASRPLELILGSPATALEGRSLSTTFAPVPGWRRLGTKLDLAEIHPWPWLHDPHDGRIGSFSTWRKQLNW